MGSSQQKQDMNRRFASGYHLLIQRENPPPQLAELQQQLAVYQDELSDLGIKDYQVPTLRHISDVNYDPDELLEKMRVPWKMAHLFLAVQVWQCGGGTYFGFHVGFSAGNVTALPADATTITSFWGIGTNKLLF